VKAPDSNGSALVVVVLLLVVRMVVVWVCVVVMVQMAVVVGTVEPPAHRLVQRARPSPPPSSLPLDPPAPWRPGASRYVF